MQIFALHLYAGFLVQFPCPDCVCVLCARPLVACVGTYNVVWWWFNAFICGGWDLGMQATEYECNFLSYELAFTQLLKLWLQYILFDVNNLCGWYTGIKWPASHFLLENVMDCWGANDVGMWLTEQLLASPSFFTEIPNFASIRKWDMKRINFVVECNKNQYCIHSM